MDPIGNMLSALAGVDATDKPQFALKTVVDKRCKCGAPAGEPRECPYKSEMGLHHEPCDCCDACRHGCAADI